MENTSGLQCLEQEGDFNFYLNGTTGKITYNEQCSSCKSFDICLKEAKGDLREKLYLLLGDNMNI